MSTDEDRLDARAESLVRSDREMLERLVALRHKHRLTIREVADRMGVAEDTVESVERYDANPTLAVLRRYSMAVEARVSHDVDDDCVPPQPTRSAELANMLALYTLGEPVSDHVALFSLERKASRGSARAYKSWSTPSRVDYDSPEGTIVWRR